MTHGKSFALHAAGIAVGGLHRGGALGRDSTPSMCSRAPHRDQPVDVSRAWTSIGAGRRSGRAARPQPVALVDEPAAEGQAQQRVGAAPAELRVTASSSGRAEGSPDEHLPARLHAEARVDQQRRVALDAVVFHGADAIEQAYASACSTSRAANVLHLPRSATALRCASDERPPGPPAARAPRRHRDLLFSDIEGSTALLKRLGDGWPHVLDRQRRLLREAIAAGNGVVVDCQGDAMFAAFRSAPAGVAAAIAAQRGHALEQWPDGTKVRVRMALHTGEPHRTSDGGYTGIDVVRAARLAPRDTADRC